MAHISIAAGRPAPELLQHELKQLILPLRSLLFHLHLCFLQLDPGGLVFRLCHFGFSVELVNLGSLCSPVGIRRPAGALVVGSRPLTTDMCLYSKMKLDAITTAST